MYFGLSEEQQSFQEIIRKFLDDEATIEKIKLFNKGDLSDFPETIHKGLLELGINNLIIYSLYLYNFYSIYANFMLRICITYIFYSGGARYFFHHVLF